LIPGLYFAYTATIPVAPRLSKPPPPSSSPSDAKEGDSTPPTTQNGANHRSPPPPQASNNNRDVPWELLFSLPTTRVTSILTWTINTILILLAADFVFTPVVDSAADVTFTRVGAVYPDAAKIVVRYPISDANVTERDVLILWRPATAAAVEPWTDGPIVHLQPESDWTNTTRLASLWPSTEYECAYASDYFVGYGLTALHRRLGTHKQDGPTVPSLAHSLPYLPGFAPPDRFSLPLRRDVVPPTQLPLRTPQKQKDQGFRLAG